ncbi:MAG TPA: glycosyltransferase [Flavobacterium sp.]|nr:glycosyltransferase [Flavobacterium sp.]
MKLTVIIPVYNVEKYIEKCIFSVLDNNLGTTDYEIIVVDDESPDNSLEIVNKIAANHNNIKVISQKNKGLGGARNTGIENASGDFLLFLDSDDWILPDALKNIVAIAEDNNPDILEFSAQGIDEQGKMTYHATNDTAGKQYEGVYYYNHFRYLNSACNKLYKRKFLVDNQLLFHEKIFIEDFEFNTRAFFVAKSVLAIPFLAAQFLQSGDSITRNRDLSRKDKMYRDFINIIEITDAEFKKHPIIPGSEAHAFFMERLSFLVATLFYQFLKYKLPFGAIAVYKKELSEKGIYHVNFPIHDKKKDLFRKIMLKNLWLFRFTQLLLRLVS